VLEFYPLRRIDFRIAIPTVSAAPTPVSHHRIARAAATLGVALLLALAGCATTPGGQTRGTAPAALPPDAEPPPPAVNLAGFPLPYRQGYADGCASAGGGERKDAARFAADGNYRTGWHDGRAICTKK
jgi:hypothetical protein